MQFNDEARAKFILEYAADLTVTILQREDVQWDDPSIAVVAVTHAANLFDAFLHSEKAPSGTH